jgi:hypothetical protein
MSYVNRDLSTPTEVSFRSRLTPRRLVEIVLALESILAEHRARGEPTAHLERQLREARDRIACIERYGSGVLVR